MIEAAAMVRHSFVGRKVEKLLEVEGLCTQFETSGGLVRAVDGISYDLHFGETIAIVGESGSGKSAGALSIMRLIPWPPGRIVSGSVRLAGRDLLKLTDHEMRQVRGREIGMVFQEPMTSLNPVLTVGRQLTETLEHHLALSREDATERAVELLGMVGIADPERRLKQYPHHFSGGMRQRVMIAMALACRPETDHCRRADHGARRHDPGPDPGADEGSDATLGARLIIITHNLGVVARYADRVNVMYAGRIVESGVAHDIYHHPRHPYTRALCARSPAWTGLGRNGSILCRASRPI